MTSWNRSRAMKAVRSKNGTFKSWKGGRKKETHNGAMSSIGHEYKRQTGKTAKVGSVVRRKNRDGKYNKGSPWYVKTVFGWRPVKNAPKTWRKKNGRT